MAKKRKNKQEVKQENPVIFEVENEHTEEMIEDEVKSCLGASKLKLTLGGVMSLALLHSPYVFGGEATDNDVKVAMSVIPSDLQPLEFHAELQKEIKSAWRIWEIVVPEPLKSGGRKSEINLFSPEWMTDIITGACRGLNVSYKEVLWEIPLAMLFHLSLSSSRQYGLITERPKGIKEALRLFKEWKRNKGK